MWHKVAKYSDIDEGKAQVIRIEGHEPIALFKFQGKLYALDNSCPHRGGSLGDGHLDGKEVICPWHAWSFDITNGQCSTDAEFKQKLFPLKIENENVFIEV